MSAKASGADASNSSSSTQHRAHTQGNQSRAFTPEQKAAVIRVRKCSHTAFYEILAIEKSATDSEIKKAYRKLSLLTHPDKNGYEGADEAFKMVSRAFQILSDSEKKEKYDRFGGDPDSRFGAGSGGGGSSGNPFESFARRSTGGMGGGRGPMFEEEISPEELFQRFFGGGGGGFGPFGGGAFGGGQQFVFNMGGGPGFRVHQFGGGPRRRPRDGNGNAREQEQNPLSVLQNLLPLIILFAVTIFSSLFSGMGGDSTPKIPEYRFTAASPFTELRTMPRLKRDGVAINYYVNPRSLDHLSRRDLSAMDRNVEDQYAKYLNHECVREQRQRQKDYEDAVGWGIFPDQEKINDAQTRKLQHCEQMAEVGLRVHYGY